MSRSRYCIAMLCAAVVFVFAANAKCYANGKTGETLYKQHCSSCHPDGGNIINPKKTLSKKDREANGIKSKDDIVKLLRKPGPGMTSFDDGILSEKAAKEIAEYILKTFK